MNRKSKHDLINAYREVFQGRLIECQSTFLSDVDQLAAIQLSVLLLKKKLFVKGDVTPMDLFVLQQQITCKKCTELSTEKPAENTMLQDYLNEGILKVLSFDEIYDAYSEFLTQCNMLDKYDIMKFLENKKEEECDVEKKSQYNEILKQAQLSDVTSPSLSQSPSKPALLHLRRVVLAYLQLIVNSRDEIALARVIDVPTRGISHDAFTDIRLFALQKAAPMFQTVSSFVRMLSLGGKGYVPDEKHVLYQHREGLGFFMELMDNLQSAVDEEPDIKSVLYRMFKILKIAMIKAKIPTFSTNILGAGFTEVMKKTKMFLHQKTFDGGNKILQLRDFLDYVACAWGNDISTTSSQLCGVLSTPQVNEKEQMKRISSLLTQFSTPKCTDGTPVKPKAKKRNYDCNSPDDIQKPPNDEVQTPLGLKNIENDDDEEESIKLIRVTSEMTEKSLDNLEQDVTRCEDEPPQKRCKNKKHSMNQISGKENKVQANKISKPAKSNMIKGKVKPKASKKLILLPGQKTMKQFFN